MRAGPAEPGSRQRKSAPTAGNAWRRASIYGNDNLPGLDWSDGTWPGPTGRRKRGGGSPMSGGVSPPPPDNEQGERHERSHQHPHRRRLQEQSGTGRLGRHHTDPPGREPHGPGRRSQLHQQPNGTHRRDQGTPGPGPSAGGTGPTGDPSLRLQIPDRRLQTRTGWASGKGTAGAPARASQ